MRRQTCTKDGEKAEVFNAFFASVFNSQTSCPQGIQPPELEDRDGELKEGPWMLSTWTLVKPSILSPTAFS